jgi:hypothetical protein
MSILDITLIVIILAFFILAGSFIIYYKLLFKELAHTEEEDEDLIVGDCPNVPAQLLKDK